MTVIDVIRYWQGLSERHASIASFATGEFWETVKAKDVLYPHLFLETPSGDTVNGTTTYQIAFSVLDRTLEGGANGTLVISACQEIAESLLKIITDIDFKEKRCPIKVMTYNSANIVNAFFDGVYGVRVEIPFVTSRWTKSCDLPLK